MVINNNEEIRTKECPDCYICGAKGELLYQGLTDRLFGAPGKWNLKKCQNPDCGLIWTDPMPIPEDLVKLYKNYFTHDDLPKRDSFLKSLYRHGVDGYLRQRYGYQNARTSQIDKLLGFLLYLLPGRRSVADASVMQLSAKSGGRLLEIGFGAGETLKRLQSLGWEVEGVDFDAAAVENARAKGLNVKVGDLASQAYPDSMFDAVISNHVIEHHPDPIALMKECSRILKPEGYLVFTTPNVLALGHRLYKTDWLCLDPPRHLYIFSPAALLRAAKESGFTEATCTSTFHGGWFLLASRMLYLHGEVGHPTPMQKLGIEISNLAEWAVCLVDKFAGEEIMLMARK